VYRVHVTSAARSVRAVYCALARAGAIGVGAAAVARRSFRVYPSFEGDVAEAPLPLDYEIPGELVVGHLMFPDGRFRSGNQWRFGGTGWTDDYPR